MDATIKHLATNGSLGTLVGVLMVGLWATPGWAKKPKEEKPKPIDGEIAGLLVAIEGVQGWIDRTVQKKM